MDWTKEEVSLIVRDYFEMLSLELSNKSYNKLAHRKALSPLLHDRYKSIEYKHRNISGVLARMGLPFIKGYKPLFNYQQLLEEKVIEFLGGHKISLERKFENFVEEKVTLDIKQVNFREIIDSPPTKSKIKDKEPLFLPIKKNYLAEEQNKRTLGEQGEQLVLDYEKWRLIKAGKDGLVDKIEWVSKEKGDGMGFDILSKNNNGTDRYIEVKTTKHSKETPIYLSRNEQLFAALKRKDFFLYRIFNFAKSPKIFIRQGNYESFCELQVQNYKGYFS